MNFNFANRMGNLQASAIREILKSTADPTVISFAAGNPAPEAFPVEQITRISAEIFEKQPIAALQYSISEGYPKLIETVKTKIINKEEILKDSDDVVIVSGAQQGIELTCKVLCNEGDTIICENPSFIGSLNAFKSYNVNLVGVDLDSDGINLAELEKALIENKNTKIIYLIPNFQNPSGLTTSLEKRKAIIELANKYDVAIIEDNPYGDLRFAGEHIQSLKSLDTEGRVIYCGSFSKVLAPGIRVGYVVAQKDFLQKLTVVKQVSDVHTNIFSQILCDKFINEVNFDEHINMLREIYKNKSTLMVNEIKANFSDKISCTTPEGGLFIWCTLPEDVDVMSFCKNAAENKVAVVPGNAFLPSDDCKNHSFRINFSTPTDENIVKGIHILGELSQKL